MSDYLDKNDYHREMVISKNNNELTKTAITMFQKHCRETSKLFRFECREDREDAMAFAIKDFISYWRNFKDLSVLKLFLKRNFSDGEEIKIYIQNLDKEFKFTAKDKPLIYTHFQIGVSGNKSLDFLKAKIDSRMEGLVEVSLHKVTRKINLMDVYNKDPKAKSFIRVSCQPDLFKDEEKLFEDPESKIYFEEPSDAFKFNTSIIRNGIIKYFNTHHPKEIRNGRKILFSRINKENNGAFNI